tara:strand:+ start:617 stop:823 length:207 start_codon:yes stop_codon:yes gene_type:complete
LAKAVVVVSRARAPLKTLARATERSPEGKGSEIRHASVGRRIDKPFGFFHPFSYSPCTGVGNRTAKPG